MVVATPTDCPKSVRNYSVIDFFIVPSLWNLFIVVWIGCWNKGLCHKIESDLFLLIQVTIGLICTPKGHKYPQNNAKKSPECDISKYNSMLLWGVISNFLATSISDIPDKHLKWDWQFRQIFYHTTTLANAISESVAKTKGFYRHIKVRMRHKQD